VNNKRNRVVMIIELVLLILSVVGNIKGLGTSGKVQFIFNLIAIVFALIYLFMEYQKSASIFYKLFAVSLVLKEAAAITNIAINEEVPAIAFILVLICYTCVTLLAVSLDLGKIKSYVIECILCIASAISLVYVMISSTYSGIIVYNATRLLLAVVFGIMIYAKYQDKEIRGTK